MNRYAASLVLLLLLVPLLLLLLLLPRGCLLPLPQHHLQIPLKVQGGAALQHTATGTPGSGSSA
jgi:hypothetical protein